MWLVEAKIGGEEEDVDDDDDDGDDRILFRLLDISLPLYFSLPHKRTPGSSCLNLNPPSLPPPPNTLLTVSSIVSLPGPAVFEKLS